MSAPAPTMIGVSAGKLAEIGSYPAELAILVGKHADSPGRASAAGAAG